MPADQLADRGAMPDEPTSMHPTNETTQQPAQALLPLTRTSPTSAPKRTHQAQNGSVGWNASANAVASPGDVPGKVRLPSEYQSRRCTPSQPTISHTVPPNGTVQSAISRRHAHQLTGGDVAHGTDTWLPAYDLTHLRLLTSRPNI